MAMKQSTSETPTSIVDPQDNFEFDRLPKEIAEEIMSRTSVESLKQLKLVNKSTYSLIKTLMTNRKFVAKHLHRRTSEEANNASPTLISSCLIVGPKKGRDYEPIVPLLTLLGNNQGDVEEHRLQPCWIEEDDDIISLTYDLKVGHCDGIVALVNESMFLSLCNPALRELVTFYVGSKIDGSMHFSWQCPVEGIGIGYDSSSECYKVVRILYGFHLFNSTLRAEVCTLGTRSWREVEISKSDWNRSLRLSSPVYFQGSCYWLTVDKILSFEMSSEAFRIVNPPDYHNSETILEQPRLRLTMWNGSVCLLCYDKKVGGQSSNYIRKWVMEIGQEDSGRAYSWRECPSFRVEPGIFKAPLAFWKEDELLVSIEDDDQIMGCYNVATGELRTVPVFQGECRTLCSNPYVASLVSVKEIIDRGK